MDKEISIGVKIEKHSIMVYGKNIMKLVPMLEELEKYGIEITVENYEKCLQDMNKCLYSPISKIRPSIVLIDSDDSGSAVIFYSIIKDEGRLENAAVFFLGPSNDTFSNHVLQLGALQYLEKPINNEKLRLMILNYLKLCKGPATKEVYENFKVSEATKQEEKQEQKQEQKELSAANNSLEVIEKNRKLLILDEDPIMLKILTTRYRNKGYEVFGTQGAEEALYIIRESRVNVIITNFAVQGSTFSEMVKAFHSANGESRILVLLTQKNEMTMNTVLKAGAEDYILKPFSPVELDLRIERLLKQW